MCWLKIDTNISSIYAKSLTEFNEYVNKYQTENKIILTKSLNISQQTLRHLPASLTWKRANHMEFQYIDGHQQIRVIYAIHYDENSENSQTISYDAINYFKGLIDIIPTDDVEEDIDLFVCPENKSSQYYNYCNDRYTNMIIDNCYSLDRNSSFMASMLTVYPQTKAWVDKYQADKLFIKQIPPQFRTKDQKELLKYDKIIIGWLKNPKYHRLHAWKKIIDNSNKVIHELRNKIEANGNVVLVVNTDAVKFINYFDYKASLNLGDFKYEWRDCKMYVKSVKSYAYYEDNKWKFKQAGKCKLDDVKSRNEWSLEDFKSRNTELTTKIIINDKGELEEIYA